MPDTDDKGLDANALVLKRALLAGVVDEEQKVRRGLWFGKRKLLPRRRREIR